MLHLKKKKRKKGAKSFPICCLNVIFPRFVFTWWASTTVGTGVTDVILQPSAVGEGVSLVGGSSWRQTLLWWHGRNNGNECLKTWVWTVSTYSSNPHSPCQCHSLLWPRSHSPPPHWRSCWHWRRTARGRGPQGSMESCHRSKNYTLGYPFHSWTVLN